MHVISSNNPSKKHKRMIKLYYQDEFATPYCGDCMEILPELNIKADLLLTDPPYGIGRDGQRKSTGKHGGRKFYEFDGWDSRRPNKEIFDVILDSSRKHVIWGGKLFFRLFARL